MRLFLRLFVGALGVTVLSGAVGIPVRGLSRPMAPEVFTHLTRFLGTSGRPILGDYPDMGFIRYSGPSPGLLQALGPLNANLSARFIDQLAQPQSDPEELMQALKVAYTASAPLAMDEIERRVSRAVQAAGKSSEGIAALRPEAQQLLLYSLYGSSVRKRAEDAGARMRSVRTMQEAHKLARGLLDLRTPFDGGGAPVRNDKPEAPYKLSRLLPSHDGVVDESRRRAHLSVEHLPKLRERVGLVSNQENPPRGGWKERWKGFRDAIHSWAARYIPPIMWWKVAQAKDALSEALQDPSFRGRIAAVLAPGIDWQNGRAEGEDIPRRLEEALGRARIRYASAYQRPDYSGFSLEDQTKFPEGVVARISDYAYAKRHKVDVELNPRHFVAREGPPRVIAGTLLHELVHLEFSLGEISAFAAERAYFQWLKRRLPASAVEERRWVDAHLAMLAGNRVDRLLRDYSRPDLDGFAQDVYEIRKRELRRARMIRRALDRLAEVPLADRAGSLQSLLPNKLDRDYLSGLLEDSAAASGNMEIAAATAGALIDRGISALESDISVLESNRIRSRFRRASDAR